MFSRVVISALLLAGMVGSAQAENTSVEEVQAATANAAPRASILHDQKTASAAQSTNVEDDLKRTEQRLEVELIERLSAIVQTTIK